MSVRDGVVRVAPRGPTAMTWPSRRRGEGRDRKCRLDRDRVESDAAVIGHGDAPARVGEQQRAALVRAAPTMEAGSATSSLLQVRPASELRYALPRKPKTITEAPESASPNRLPLYGNGSAVKRCAAASRLISRPLSPAM